jgi:hypothetical protein
MNTVVRKQFELSNSVSTQFYVITVVKLRFFKINLRLGGSWSKSRSGPDPARGPPVGHRWSRHSVHKSVSSGSLQRDKRFGQTQGQRKLEAESNASKHVIPTSYKDLFLWF